MFYIPVTFPYIVHVTYARFCRLQEGQGFTTRGAKKCVKLRMYCKVFWYSLFRDNAFLGAFRHIFTLAFLLFLAPAGDYNPAGQSPNLN